MIKNSFFCLLIFLASGCATIQSLDIPSKKVSFRELPFEFSKHDYAGVFHVHSRFSHDSKGRFDEIAAAAQKAGADFVVVTDHNTLRGLREKMDGFYGPTLVLIGSELSTRAGHLSVLGVDKEVDASRELTEITREVKDSGGLSFVSHGESRHKPWSDWTVQPLTGMEIYNLASDVYQDGKFWVALKAMSLPPKMFFKSVLDKPEKYLRRWDDLLKSQPVTGIGAVDAHQKVRLFGRALDKYDTMFKVVQTHAWCERLTRRDILEAFRQGHVYVGFGLVRPARNFLFWAEKNGQKWLMGDTLEYDGGLKLKVYVPGGGEIRILKDGQVIYKIRAESAEIEPAGQGVYRTEVYYKKKLWILSNPVYLN